jgi:hypothetical protein
MKLKRSEFDMAFSLRSRNTDVLRDNTLHNYYVNQKIAGYQFDVRLGYYRGLYLSCIDELSLKVDNEEIDEFDILFCLNDKQFSVKELYDAYYEFWNIVEPATLKVAKPGGLSEGPHEIELTLILRSPYLPMPGNEEHSYAPIDSCDKKVLILT